MIKIKVNGKHMSYTTCQETHHCCGYCDNLGLTGTKYGCGISECGACTVHLDGKAIQACVMAASEVGDSEVTTIEGLSSDGSHPVQKAWKEHNVPQLPLLPGGPNDDGRCHAEINNNPSDERYRN